MSLKIFFAGVFSLIGIPFFSLGTTFTVTDNSDSGAGTLRQAILDANTTVGANIINFNIPGGGVQIIAPFDALPAVTNQVTIDATTQPGYAGTPLVVLSGNNNGYIDGLTISALGCAIKGLVIGNFGGNIPSSGIVLLSASNTVTACYIGVSETGVATRFNHDVGILISNAPGNVIGGLDMTNRNLIGGNNVTGVFITGANASNNVVLGNWFSLGADGSTLLANFTADIIISNAPNNTIGGATAAARNVLEGYQTSEDILINGGATGNAILGNYVNLRPDGSPAPSLQAGILVQNATGTVIGGTTAGARNVISGCNYGVEIINATTTGTVVQGNYLGTDPTGLTGEFNNTSVFIQGSSGNLIGGTAPGAGNVIVGKGSAAVWLSQGANNNVVQGNLIGTDVTGMNALKLNNGSLTDGVLVGGTTATTNNLIGGSTAGARNVISGLTDNGVEIDLLPTSNNVVQGNFIGTDVTGNQALGNAYDGVLIYGATGTLIGGTNSGEGNVISANGGYGVDVQSGASGTVIQGNTIGLTFDPIPDWNVGGILFSYAGPGEVGSPFTPAGDNNLGFPGNSYAIAALWSDPINVWGNNFYSSGPADNPIYLLSPDVTPPSVAIPSATFNINNGFFTVVCNVTGTPGDTTFIQLYDFNPIPDPETSKPSGTATCTIGVSGTGSCTVSGLGNLGDECAVTATDQANGTSELSIPVTPTMIGTTPIMFPTTTANFDFSAWAGCPVSTFTGELYESLPADLDLGGPLPLSFQRYYAAFIQKDGLITGALGGNWLHNFEMTLTTTPSNTVNVVNNRGRLIQFTNSGGAFSLIGTPDIPFQLTASGGNYVLGDPRSQMLYTFNSIGRLTTIADGHGNAQTLSYTGSQLASVTDGLGRTLTFQYNGSGFLTNVSDGTRSVGFVQTGNNLTSSTDALGLVTTYSYDLTNSITGLMTAMTLPAGNAPFTQTFDAQGRVLSQTAAGSNTTTLAYASLVTTITDPLGRTNVHTYTATGEFSALTDETGLTLTLGNDANRRRTSVTDRLGQTTFIGYHAPSGKPAALTNADGTVAAFAYASRAVNGITFYDLAQVSYPDGTSESFTYDTSGNVLTRTDRAAKVFTFTYNARGQPLTAQNPLGGVTTFAYDGSGRLASRMDTDTGLTTFQYDSLDRLTNVIHPDSTALRTQFDANDRLLFVTDERGDTTTFNYDNDNRLIAAVDAAGKTNQLFFDGFNRVVRATDRLGNSTVTSYDALDLVASVTNRNGNVTSFAYDTRQRLSAFTDPGGKIWSFGYDNEAIPASSTNPLGQTDSQRVNLLGYPVAFTNALGQVSSVARDAMERTTNSLDEISRTNGFGYDARGLLANTTAPLIGTAAYLRNNLGLLSGITGLNGEQWDFAYTPMGRLQSLADPLNRTSAYSYDNRGRLQRTVFADGVTRSNSYDQASNPTRRQYSSGPDLQFSYDSLDRLTSANDLSFVYDPEGRVTNTISSGVNQGAAYDADGRLTSITCQNGAFTVHYTYDSRDRLTQVGDTLTGTQINFNYDDAGRLTGITRPNGVNGTYTYDAAGRLTRIQEGSIIDIQCTVDAAGQVVAANFTAPLDPATLLAPEISTFTYDAAHQIKNSGYAFDARGRQTASPGHSYQWDGASRMVGIDGVALAYNGADDLETRTTGGVTTRYFYNHALGLTPIMAERNENTLQVQRYYVWTPGGQLLYLIDATSGNAVRFFHYDRIGSTLALTSAAGTVTDAYAYSPYGVLLGHTGTSPQPFTYVGEFGVRGEAAANLYHMRARYYDPVSARFLTRDSLWPTLADPRKLDPYQYVEGSPLKYIDPVGRDNANEQRFGHWANDWGIAESDFVEGTDDLQPLGIDSYSCRIPGVAILPRTPFSLNARYGINIRGSVDTHNIEIASAASQGAS
jgi:RHS repeat-associated protein